MSLTRNEHKSKASKGSAAHPYVVQKHLAERPRYVAVRDNRYLCIIETDRKTAVLLEVGEDYINVVINYKREQKFSLEALRQPDRILDYLELQDDDNHVFAEMCAAVAEALSDRASDRPLTVAEQKAAARASLNGALKSQQPQRSIGSVPVAWEYR